MADFKLKMSDAKDVLNHCFIVVHFSDPRTGPYHCVININHPINMLTSLCSLIHNEWYL